MARTPRKPPNVPPPPGTYANLRSRFIPLAESRMTAVLEAMDYLEQLSQRNRYHYADEEWEAMHRALQAKLTELDESFRRGKGSRPVFKFGEDEL